MLSLQQNPELNNDAINQFRYENKGRRSLVKRSGKGN